MKTLHTGDWHLRDCDIAECRKCLNHMVETTRNLCATDIPDLIVIAGDLFDSRNVKLDSESARLCFETVSDLADIAPVAVLIGTPSHDGLAAELLEHINREFPVIVSSKPEQIYLDSSEFRREKFGFPPDAIISMVPTPTKQYWNSASDIKGTDGEIAQAMSAVFAGFGAEAETFYTVPHILVGHFSVGGASLNDTQVMIGRDIEISGDQIALAKADVVCLGHIHRAQRIKPNVFYCGSLYRKDFGELDPKGFYIHEIVEGDNKDLESTWIDTPSRTLYRIGRDLTQQENPDFSISSKIEEVKAAIGAQLRIEVRVWQDEADKIDVEAISDQYIQLGAEDVQVRITRVPRAQVRSETMLTLATLRDKLAERARLNGDTVSESILAKADLMEAEPAETIFKNLRKAVQA